MNVMDKFSYQTVDLACTFHTKMHIRGLWI